MHSGDGGDALIMMMFDADELFSSAKRNTMLVCTLMAEFTTFCKPLCWILLSLSIYVAAVLRL